MGHETTGSQSRWVRPTVERDDEARPAGTRVAAQGSDARPRARRGDGGSQGGSDTSNAQLYDTIGAAYTVTRRTEPRIAARVWAALGDARTVLNVGAGTGSYEPPGRDVTAVEPSALMRAQRPADASRCVAAVAESLPFEDQSFDAAMAVATVHHWQDPIAGLREMRRVARRVVVFTHDSSDTGWRRRFWLTRDYLPEVADLVAGRPPLSEQARAIGARIEPVLIPWDCADGFFEAYWRRPEAYLDDHVRRGVSVWARLGPDAERRAVRSLRDDLVSGRWAERNRDLVALDAAELGLRLLVT
jgi:SAM-dependent methyltransferase